MDDDIGDSHCAYIKAQFNSLDAKHATDQESLRTNPSKRRKTVRKKVYECVNLWGIHDVCPVIEFDSPAIKAIYKIQVLNCDDFFF